MRRFLSESSSRWRAVAGPGIATLSPSIGADFQRALADPHYGCRAARRRGISLLEVTFSIGVVMIGLVGIASLLPLGGALAKKGAIADAGAQLGANAVREFTARGMADPRNWRWINPSIFLADGVTPQPGISFCIDPVYITAADPALPTYASELTARAIFPSNAYFTNNDADPANDLLFMRRITLRDGITLTGVLDATAANSIFVGADDLVFDLPADRTLGPVQNFSFLNASPANPLKRNSQGRMSWFATIVPKLDRLGSAVGYTPVDEYILSIVVFAQRPVDRELFDNGGNQLSEDLVSERVGGVAQFYSGSAAEIDPAFSGGDVTLATRNGRGPDDLELRNGDWIMLSGQKSTLAGPVIVHKWYRVVQAGDEPQPVPPLPQPAQYWTRDVTLMGPDWNIPVTQFTIVRGVVQVMERTIRLETSSMWTN